MSVAPYCSLTPLARQIFRHMHNIGHISAMDAMRALGITSASLTRRLTDIEEAGYKVARETAVDPITKRKYTRYSLAA